MLLAWSSCTACIIWASRSRVLTPELLSLADYHVDRSSVDLIGYSACALSAQLGQKVGVLGLSFAGGLSLLAAADPRFAPCIRFVVSIDRKSTRLNSSHPP